MPPFIDLDFLIIVVIVRETAFVRCLSIYEIFYYLAFLQ